MGLDLWTTTQRMAITIAMATAIGVPAGLLLGISERIYRSVEFIIDFFRSTKEQGIRVSIARDFAVGLPPLGSPLVYMPKPKIFW